MLNNFASVRLCSGNEKIYLQWVASEQLPWCWWLYMNIQGIQSWISSLNLDMIPFSTISTAFQNCNANTTICTVGFWHKWKANFYHFLLPRHPKAQTKQSKLILSSKNICHDLCGNCGKFNSYLQTHIFPIEAKFWSFKYQFYHIYHLKIKTLNSRIWCGIKDFLDNRKKWFCVDKTTEAQDLPDMRHHLTSQIIRIIHLHFHYC